MLQSGTTWLAWGMAGSGPGTDIPASIQAWCENWPVHGEFMAKT
jgi:hypothetical protein